MVGHAGQGKSPQVYSWSPQFGDHRGGDNHNEPAARWVGVVHRDLISSSRRSPCRQPSCAPSHVRTPPRRVRSCSPSSARQAECRRHPAPTRKMTHQRSCLVVPGVEVCASRRAHLPSASESRPSRAPAAEFRLRAHGFSLPRRAPMTRRRPTSAGRFRTGAFRKSRVYSRLRRCARAGRVRPPHFVPGPIFLS